MKRSILEQSWAVAKPRHAGAAYNRRARTVALVTSWREGVGSPWALSIRTAYRDLEQEPRVSVRWGPTLRSPLRTKPRTGRTSTRETPGMGGGGTNRARPCIISSRDLLTFNFKLLFMAQAEILFSSEVTVWRLEEGTRR